MSGSAPFLSRPPWLALAISASVLTALACYPSWPGYMSYDSLLAYEQAVYGVRTALWPPLHTYMFQLSRMIGADSWGLFLVQTFVLMFGAGLTIHVLTPRRALAWTLCLCFAGGRQVIVAGAGGDPDQVKLLGRCEILGIGQG